MNALDNITEGLRNLMPDDVAIHYRAALSDLYHGPHSPDYWRVEYDSEKEPSYSFTASCKVVADWWDDKADVPSYCDEDGEPIGTDDVFRFEDDHIPYYEVVRAVIKRKLFGELASYL